MKVLIVYTISYPFGKSEQSFLEPEIEFFSHKYDEIWLCPRNTQDNFICPTPVNVKRLQLSSSTEKSAIGRAFVALFLLSQEFLRFPFKVLSNGIGIFSYAKQMLGLKESLEALLNDNPNIQFVHYSYWMSDWATVLSLSKLDGIKISRAHGFDLYDDRSPLKFQLFRKMQLKRLDWIAPISEVGKSYLVHKFPKYSDKIDCIKLGIPDHSGLLFPSFKEERYEIVSCSSLIPLKRVHLITEILSNAKVEIRWTHIGDGPERESIERWAENMPSNIQFELLGNLSWSQVIEVYRTKSFDVFIQCSETEGIPVSIMEAINFGTPVMATDVGGMAEAVPDKHLLLEKDFSPKEIGALLDETLKGGWTRKKAVRNSIRQYWEEHFDASKNYAQFSERINHAGRNH